MVTAKEYSTLCAQVNGGADAPAIPAGWTLIRTASNPHTGFYAEAYNNGTEIVIACRGTDDRNGLFNNEVRLDPMRDECPGRHADAQAFYRDIRDTFGSTSITVTGHSLGDGLAELVCLKNNGFSAIRVGNIDPFWVICLATGTLEY